MTFVSESFHLSGHLTCGIRCWGSIYNFTYFATFRSLPNLRKYEMSISQNVRHIFHPRPAPLSPTLVQKQLNSCAKSEQQTFYLPRLLLIYVTLQMASFMSLPIKVLFRQDTLRRERAAPNAKSVKFLARKCDIVT